MRIAILDLTAQHGEQFDGIPRVGREIADWLAPFLPEAVLAIHDIAHGAALPDVGTFDGLLVSGSEFGVYDDTPWMAPLRRLLEATREAGKPVFGICFGHQIMADVYGGKAEKSAQGNHVGLRHYDMDGARVDANVWHKDQVTRVPPGARVIGSASYCPVSALAYGFPALSVQFHPEYSEARLRQLFAIGRDVFIDGADVDAAEASFAEGRARPDLMAAETAAFFRDHVRPAD